MGLKLVPLPEHMQRAWRHGAWGNATDTHAAGGLLKLTDALPHKTGWAAHPAPSPSSSPLPSPTCSASSASSAWMRCWKLFMADLRA